MSTKLDELDGRFFKELPFLIDVFASSFKKLKEMISFYFEMFENDINNFTRENSEWSRNTVLESFTPFYSPYDKPKSLQVLSAEFTFDKSIETVNQSISKAFSISCGFWYSDWAEDNKPFLYFGIYRYKANAAMIPLLFYNSLDLANYKKEIKHPSEESKDESIEIRIFELNDEELKKGLPNILETNIAAVFKEIRKGLR